MEDDIFAQLADLVNNKPAPTNTTGVENVVFGFGNTTFSDASSNSSSSFLDDSSMFEPDDIIVPDIKPKKATRSRKLIVVIDDDFSTLDLMKIYLQRDYEYVSFDNPKNAIFYLNTNIPDLIFVDCYLNFMNTKRVIEIIRTYKELQDVPIIYLAEPAEQSAIRNKLPEGVLDIISRPVKRGDLQNILDMYIKPDDEAKSSSES